MFLLFDFLLNSSYFRYTRWAKSRYTVYSIWYTAYYIPTFGPPCTRNSNTTNVFNL